MSNTPHPGRPGPDELVPSRYALRVGEIDVLVISDGVFTLPAATLATNADLSAWLPGRTTGSSRWRSVIGSVSCGSWRRLSLGTGLQRVLTVLGTRTAPRVSERRICRR